MRNFIKGLLIALVIGFIGFVIGQFIMWKQYQLDPNEPPVNYLASLKDEVHDELFEKETEKSKEIVERLFKYVEYEVVDSNVKGEMATVTMKITNINGGAAWQDALERHAILCFDNAFSENYVGTEALEEEYLISIEKAFKAADYITTTVDVKMEFIGTRWVVNVDQALVDAITGNLMSAKQGREIPTTENKTEESTQNEYIEVPLEEEWILASNGNYVITVDTLLFNKTTQTYEWVVIYENKTDEAIYAYTEDMLINNNYNQDANFDITIPANSSVSQIICMGTSTFETVQFEITSCKTSNWSTIKEEQIIMEFSE